MFSRSRSGLGWCQLLGRVGNQTAFEQIVLDLEEAVVLYGAFAAGRGAGLEELSANGDGEVRDKVGGGFTGTVGHDDFATGIILELGPTPWPR